jgi:hypothetical protein
VAERFGFQLVQPALSRASHTAWKVTRRHPALSRRTRFVEIGPVTMMSRDAYRVLAPFPEHSMGWGMCLHWAAIAERHGWSLGIVDAVPARHEARPPAAGYSRREAIDAALGFLADREHLTYGQAEETLASHQALP